jgi:hypothetical protein
MSNRMDNLQTVFDRTDWTQLLEQKLSLMVAINSAQLHGRTQTAGDMKRLLNWLEAVEDAAKMDGYQVKPLTDEETTP